MKKILVPTDFSDVAKDAYLFACEIAQNLGSSIKVVHAFTCHFDPEDPLLASPLEKQKAVLKKEMTTFIAKVSQQDIVNSTTLTQRKVEYDNIFGFAVDEIVELSSQADTSMIVMGSTGCSGVFEKLFGSISAAVTQKAHCPVLLIPKGVRFNDFHNILYASNYDEANENAVKEVAVFAQKFNASIHFVHVCKDKEKEFLDKEQLFQQMFRKEYPNLSFSMATVTCESVMEGLNQYALENNIDLVVMITRHRSMWENIIHKSLTRQMKMVTTLPLMVIHLDDSPDKIMF